MLGSVESMMKETLESVDKLQVDLDKTHATKSHS